MSWKNLKIEPAVEVLNPAGFGERKIQVLAALEKRETPASLSRARGVNSILNMTFEKHGQHRRKGIQQII